MTEKKKVLIIDDDFQIIKIIKYKLLLEGYEVFSALNGVEGLKLAFTELPALIFMDIMMPEMNGYEVLRLLKSDKRTKTIPVVMVTARTQDSDKEKAERIGIVDYVHKPFSPQTLVNVLKRILG